MPVGAKCRLFFRTPKIPTMLHVAVVPRCFGLQNIKAYSYTCLHHMAKNVPDVPITKTKHCIFETLNTSKYKYTDFICVIYFLQNVMIMHWNGKWSAYITRPVIYRLYMYYIWYKPFCL